MDNEARIHEQISFYRQIAGEYDQQVYDEQHWKHMADAVLEGSPHVATCLEIASGTGLWTQRLLEYADAITAVDSSPEMHAISAVRVSDSRVSRLTADVFNFELSESYDLVFAAFWLSHIPMERFDAFWVQVATYLKPNGRVLFVDSYSSGPGGGGSTRQLPDGREFNIVKVNHNLVELGERLGRLGWDAQVKPVTDNVYSLSGKLI